MSEGSQRLQKSDEAELRRKKHLECCNVEWLTRNTSPAQKRDIKVQTGEKAQTEAKDPKQKQVKTPESNHGDGSARSKEPKQPEWSGRPTDDVSRSGSPEIRASSTREPRRYSRERRNSVSEQKCLNENGHSGLNPHDPSLSIRRTKSLSLNSKGHIEENKPGFLRSLFSRKKKAPPRKEAAKRSSGFFERSSRPEVPKPPSTAPSVTQEEPLKSSTVPNNNDNKTLLTDLPMPPISRSKTVPISPDDEDIKLENFLQRFRSATISSGNAVRSPPRSIPGKFSRPNTAKSKATFSIDEDVNSIDDTSSQHHFDAKGRPVPAHPTKSSFPPALKKCNRTPRTEKSKRTSISSPTTTNKFGAFLKRVTSHTDEQSSRTSLMDSESDSEDEEGSGGFQNGAKINIPGLEDLRPLRKVSFATNTYFNDPPQQICSKNPRRGEVEVKSDGSVVIHRLTPEEKREILQRTTAGIVVGGSGHLKLLSNPTVNEDDVKRNEERKPETSLSRNEEADSTSNEDLNCVQNDVASSAQKNSSDLEKATANNEEEVSVNKAASEVKIDKPMISRRSACSLDSNVSITSEDNDEPYPPTDVKIPHDVVYTRCCHLREILPIPAMLKQLKKGSTDPIPLLQLRNPKPSLIEVLSFSDFLSIAPVLCLSLDGVNLSTEMLNVIMCALTHKKEFEKLSLRNTPLDHDGWRILCYFVSGCKSLRAIDLTMVPGISINVQKPSKSSQKSRVVRMECSLENRKEMNWDLLTASLATNSGLEEIILSGATMSLPQFKNFIELGCMQTERLGLAYNQLTVGQCTLLAEWLVRSKVTGLDMAFNDLRGKLGRFSSTLIEKMQHNSNVFKYLSLNSTNLEVAEDSTSRNNDVLKLISSLCYCDNLKLLDLSNNPQIFPHITRHLTNYLPVFVNLIRLQLDFNNIPPTSVVTLAEVLPMCQKLSYVSMRGTKLDCAAGCALAAAMRKSSSLLTLDLDLEGVSEKIRDKLSLYGMRNLETALNKVNDVGSTGMSDNLLCLQKELSDLLTEKPVKKEDVAAATQSFVARLTKARSFINKMTEDLFKLRVEGNLTTGGKETLIRFCFIDATFERGLRLLAQRYDNSISLPSHPTDDLDFEGSDMKRVGSTATLSSKNFSESGHSALLPFHYPPIETQDPADDAVEIKEDGPDTLGSHARDQLKEEGSILRKTHGIKEHVKKNNEICRSQIDSEGKLGFSNAGATTDSSLDPHALKKAVSELDSDEIKDFILTNDISSVAELLEELRRRGVNLNDIFKKRHEQCASGTLGGVLSDGSVSDVKKSKTVTGVQANLQDEVARKEKGSSSDSETDTDISNEGEAIDRVYDEVLDNIERVRTNSHV
ncbi:LANO_0H09472g1_1 [Lachancea nothofagi CBS 11611]|uniref:LANO_0H09472g1_1 n=1 Tax=Lachancea nothofagi CBS 11611 TaxID=1266666 RepID=A0A1G4KM71_9SACH|nr:LANO_0H09472g1_1 [Lachancea nothofagi CBS 11611]